MRLHNVISLGYVSCAAQMCNDNRQKHTSYAEKAYFLFINRSARFSDVLYHATCVLSIIELLSSSQLMPLIRKSRFLLRRRDSFSQTHPPTDRRPDVQ